MSGTGDAVPLARGAGAAGGADAAAVIGAVGFGGPIVRATDARTVPPPAARAPSAYDTARWAARLAEEPTLFEPLATGARVGVVAECVMEERAPRATQMMVWERDAGGMRVQVEPYEGFVTTAVDLLIALDDTAERALADDPDGGWLRTVRRLLRDGHVLFFARRPCADLEDAGYDDLLHELGFAWLGACR